MTLLCLDWVFSRSFSFPINHFLTNLDDMASFLKFQYSTFVVRCSSFNFFYKSNGNLTANSLIVRIKKIANKLLNHFGFTAIFLIGLRIIKLFNLRICELYFLPPIHRF